MPFQADRYPENWKEIRAHILRRAGGDEDSPNIGARCEWCGVRNYTVKDDEQIKECDSYAVARDWATHLQKINIKAAVVVLTIAHVTDMNPQNCADDNLAALCQKCHNGHDVKYRRLNASTTRRRKRIEAGQLEMTL